MNPCLSSRLRRDGFESRPDRTNDKALKTKRFKAFLWAKVWFAFFNLLTNIPLVLPLFLKQTSEPALFLLNIIFREMVH